MTKTLTPEQLERLSGYERYFDQATTAAWCSYPGQAAIAVMLDTWKELTGSPYPYKAGCPNCLLNLVRDLGHVYKAAKKDNTPAKVDSFAVESESLSKRTTTPKSDKVAKKAPKSGEKKKK
jgi:hypothetical protein